MNKNCGDVVILKIMGKISFSPIIKIKTTSQNQKCRGTNDTFCYFDFELEMWQN